MIKVKNNVKLIALLAVLLFVGAFLAPLFSSNLVIQADSGTQYFTTTAGWGVDKDGNFTGTAPTEKWYEQILGSINWDEYPDNVTVNIIDGTGEREIQLNWDENGNFVISSEIEFAIYSFIQGNAIITRNLDMSEFIWTPIDNFYNDTLDGGNFTVSGIYVNDNENSNTGLFATILDSTIKNLNINQSYIKGRYNVGGIVGYVNKSPETIENCTFDGVVIGKNCVGGIAGILYYSTVNNCFSYGFIIGNYHEYSSWTVCLGGLVGVCQSSIVKNSGNFALINFYTVDLDSVLTCAVGGIIGSLDGYYSSVYNCFNRGDIVSGTLQDINLSVGGLLGEMIAGVMINCYNTGDIRLEDANLSDGVVVGGLVGNSDFSENANLLNCYTAGDIVITLPNATVEQGLIAGFAVDYGANLGIEYCYALEIEELELIGFAGDQKPSNCGEFDNSQELIRIYYSLNDEIELGDELLSLLNNKPSELFANNNRLESDWEISSSDIKPWRADNANVNKGFPVFAEACSLTFETNGGTFASSYTPPASYTENESVTLPTSNNISRPNYNFLGWTETNETSDITYITTLSQTATGNKTLYAKWQLITYTITYDLNGGENHADNPATYTIQTESFSLQEPTKTDCVFIGWTFDGQSVPTKSVTISLGTAGNKTFTANWKVIKLQSSENVEDNLVYAEIELPSGVEDGAVLIVVKKEISELSSKFSVPEGKEIVNAYNAKLVKNDVEIFPDGTMTIKMLLPNELKGKSNVQVFVWDAVANQGIFKTAVIDGEYISFETDILNDFVFVADISSNLLVLWLILGIISGLLVLFLLWVFLYKRNVTFMLNGKKVGEARYKKGEALNFPSNLAKYKWFSDKEETKLFTKQKMGWFGFNLYRNTKH